jgi:hypothetical protein
MSQVALRLGKPLENAHGVERILPPSIIGNILVSILAILPTQGNHAIAKNATEAKMAKNNWTMAGIKQELERYGEGESSHFFDRKTMRFFGQHMSDFKVKTSPTGRIFIFAPMYTGMGGGFCSYTMREFIPYVGNIRPHLALVSCLEVDKDKRDSITAYIKAH